MFVSGAGQIVASATPGAGVGEAVAVAAGAAPSGAGAAGGGNGAGGSYVIQGGYVLGSGGAANQSYTHNARASPATVSILTEGEANSVPSADKKVCGEPRLLDSPSYRVPGVSRHGIFTQSVFRKAQLKRSRMSLYTFL